MDKCQLDKLIAKIELTGLSMNDICGNIIPPLSIMQMRSILSILDSNQISFIHGRIESYSDKKKIIDSDKKETIDDDKKEAIDSDKKGISDNKTDNIVEVLNLWDLHKKKEDIKKYKYRYMAGMDTRPFTWVDFIEKKPYGPNGVCMDFIWQNGVCIDFIWQTADERHKNWFDHWGRYEDGYYDYGDCLTLVFAIDGYNIRPFDILVNWRDELEVMEFIGKYNEKFKLLFQNMNKLV